MPSLPWGDVLSTINQPSLAVYSKHEQLAYQITHIYSPSSSLGHIKENMHARFVGKFPLSVFESWIYKKAMTEVMLIVFCFKGKLLNISPFKSYTF